METTICINFAENEDYPCVIGMLKQSSRYKENYEFYENKCYPKPQCDGAVSTCMTRQIKENCECCEINDS